MSNLPKNHDHIYFDKLCRTKKSETVLSLIYATYQVKLRSTNSNLDKQNIAQMLQYAYILFKGNAGSYTGEISAFESQYTIGHELGIWKNSSLDLSDLALKVAKNKITVREYFDIVFLNYIQPVNNKMIHILFEILEYLKSNNSNEITKTEMRTVYGKYSNNHPDDDINAVFNMLLGTNYFTQKSKDTIVLELNIDELMSRCNIEYKNKEYSDVLTVLNNADNYLKYLLNDNGLFESEYTVKENNIESVNTVGKNVIYYGIPGCGKSYHVEHRVLENVDKKHNVFRTTFFLDYSNTDFIGQILPKVEDNDVTYEPMPGPFTRALERAFTVRNEMIYLVIEEINRGNAAAIFGDVFQLLDRLEKDYDGRVIGDSEYPIAHEFIDMYFQKRIQEGADIKYTEGKIFIPHNLTILATMNTSDQNVFPLDTAFKRRWERERVIPDWNEVDFKDDYIPFTDYTWKTFTELINKKMIDESIDGIIMEDKQLGPYFISKNMLASKDKKNIVDDENKDKLKKFINNVIDYTYSDISKFDRENWFEPNVSFDDIYNAICKYKSDENTNEESFDGNDKLCLKLNASNNTSNLQNEDDENGV